MNIYLLYQGEGIQIRTLPCCTVDNKIEMLKALFIFWNPFLYNCGKNFDNHVNFLKSHEISWYLCDMSIYEMLMSVKYEILYVVCSAVIIDQPPLPNKVCRHEDSVSNSHILVPWWSGIKYYSPYVPWMSHITRLLNVRFRLLLHLAAVSWIC